MTNNTQFKISRRKVLAGLGTVGIASAGAGLGTTAYFSDVESFSDNTLQAGSLDLKVDWEEHYSDWSDDETAFARMPGVEETPDYVLPALTSQGQLMTDARPIELVFTGQTPEEKQAAKDDLWDATSVEAYPDGRNNGDYDGIQDEFTDAEACDILADVADDGSKGLSSPLRTQGTFAGQTTNPGDPLISLNDIKPGDFGEVTLSFHLCDNPGYVWLNGDLVSARENGETEPEAADPDSMGAADEVSGPDDLETSTVELLDSIATRIWYDPDCDNMVDMVAGELDIMLALDTSGSINQTEMDNLKAGVAAFVDALPNDGSVEVGSLTFGNNAISDFNGLQSPSDLNAAGFGLPTSGNGNTPLPAALDIADQELAAMGRPAAQKVLVVFTDGGPNYRNTVYSAGGYTAPRGSPDTTGFSNNDANDQYDGVTSSSPNVSQGEADETANVADAIRGLGTRIVTVNIADNPNDSEGDISNLGTYLEDEIASSGFAFIVALDDLAMVADSLVASITAGEEVFFQGTLREALVELSKNQGRGIPLDGNTDTAFDELADPENDPDRDCFAGAGVTHCVGFQWWLPINHANQIQTDIVEFDLGFYTEQCRHNDGAGMVPEETVTA